MKKKKRRIGRIKCGTEEGDKKLQRPCLQNSANLILILLSVHHECSSRSVFKDFTDTFSSLCRALKIFIGVNFLGNPSTLQK